MKITGNAQAEQQTTAMGWQARLADQPDGLRVHLIGIGGVGLSAIATVLMELGVRVSGSDRQQNANMQRLATQGATIYDSQSPANLTDLPGPERPDVVLISSAISADNPERRAAHELGLPVAKRDEFLAALLAKRTVIAVAGSHGKSTTTAMIVKLLREAGIETGYIIGTDLPGFGNASAGKTPHFVIEADEYDHMFLGLRPKVAVITNVEWDHPDCFPTPSSFRAAFSQFVGQVADDGLIISCMDDEGAEAIRQSSPPATRWITYGRDEAADLRVVDVASSAGEGISADLIWWHAPAGRMTLSAPGLHNLRNALAALAVSCWCDIPSGQALASLRSFRGTARRFDLKGEAAGVTVIDDYAHHPTEVVATLAAARGRYPDRRIWALFQPHTFSRTRTMLYRMGESFEAADRVIVTDIYAAREVDDGSVNASELVAASPHRAIQHIASLGQASDYLADHVEAGDVVVTLGAGDGYLVGEELLRRLRQTTEALTQPV